jgi:hypothetical protein
MAASLSTLCTGSTLLLRNITIFLFLVAISVTGRVNPTAGRIRYTGKIHLIGCWTCNLSVSQCLNQYATACFLQNITEKNFVKSSIILDTKSYSPFKDNHHFGGTYRHLLQGSTTTDEAKQNFASCLHYGGSLLGLVFKFWPHKSIPLKLRLTFSGLQSSDIIKTTAVITSSSTRNFNLKDLDLVVV